MVTSKTAKADHQGRQDASRTLQEGRRWPQARESLKIAQEASKTVSKDPGEPHNHPRGLEDRLKTDQDTLWEAWDDPTTRAG